MDSDIPLYAQLVGIIKRNISTGALAVGVCDVGKRDLALSSADRR